MKLWCFDEKKYGWGHQLWQCAVHRGIDAEKFRTAESVSGGFSFMRVRQHEPHRTSDQVIAEQVNKQSVLIPDIDQIRLYEDKEKQVGHLGSYLPLTRVFYSADEVDYLPFPFLSKSREGSASVNVRLVETPEQADREVRDAFSVGIKTRRGIQRGYLIWQQFLENNRGDYRVIAVGRQRMVLRRWNRNDSPMASGSGLFTAIKKPNKEIDEVLAVSDEYFMEARTNWCGLDLVKDHSTNEWKIIETTIAWTPGAYNECRFIGTDRFGCDIWNVLLDEIEAGVFA